MYARTDVYSGPALAPAAALAIRRGAGLFSPRYASNLCAHFSACAAHAISPAFIPRYCSPRQSRAHSNIAARPCGLWSMIECALHGKGHHTDPDVTALGGAAFPALPRAAQSAR